MTSRLREAILWGGAVAGLLSMVAAVAVTFFGFSFLIFRSGSMGPDIPTGSLALARTVPAAELRSGDVVSVIAFNGERITHRVVDSTVRIDEDETEIASLILQGDANGTPDDEIYQVAEAEREIASVPFVGYAVTVLLSPAGLIAGGCLAGMLLLLGFGSSPDGPRQPPTRGGGRHRGDLEREARRPRAAVAAVSMVATLVVGASVASTSAFFLDEATIRSGEFSSRTLPAPSLTCVQGQGATVNVNFPTVAFPSSVTYTASLDTGTALNVSGNGNSRSVTINQTQAPGGGLSLFGTSRDYTVTVSVTSGAWSASSTTDIRSLRAGIFAGSTDMVCL